MTSGSDRPPEHQPRPHDSWAGLCRGGPYSGRLMTSRFPEGFLLVDRISGRLWVYDYHATAGEFRARSDIADTDDGDRRWQAAEGTEYDVIALDEGAL